MALRPHSPYSQVSPDSTVRDPPKQLPCPISPSSLLQHEETATTTAIPTRSHSSTTARSDAAADHAPEVFYEAPKEVYQAPKEVYYNAEASQQPNWPLPPDEQRSIPKKRICGFRPITFWLSVALAAVIVIAAAVGGGVGGWQAAKNRSNSRTCAANSGAGSSRDSSLSTSGTGTALPSSTASSKPTTTRADVRLGVPTKGVVPLDCPGRDGNKYTRRIDGSQYAFNIECATNHINNGNEWIDIIPTVAYSLEACMDACAGYNKYAVTSGCVAVTFNADLGILIDNGGRQPGNCYIKNGTGTMVKDPAKMNLASAVLNIGG